MATAITVVSSMATKRLLADLASAFEAETGICVHLQAMGGVDAARAVRAGSPADIIILAAPVIAELAQEGHIAPGSIAPVAVSKMALAVRAGLALPDIADGDAVRTAMLAAHKVAYSTGPSGDHLRRLWAAWRIEADMAARALLAPPGIAVASLLADGAATLGIQQTSELIGQPGVTLVGPLPDDIQSLTTFAAGLIAPPRQAGPPAAFIRFASSPGHAGLRHRHGMDQPGP